MQSVYGLTDPWDELPHYVGRAQDVYRRYAQHLNSPHENAEKNAWMGKIKAAGKVPGLTIFEQDIEDDIAPEREKHWIEHWLKLGAPLTNIVHNPLRSELSDRNEYEPVRWIVDGILPEGLTMLCSAPKTGKSMIALAFAVRMARRTHGGIDGDTLYLSLDDTSERRLQSRIKSLLQGREVSDHLSFAMQAQSLDTGLIEQLGMWVKEHADTRLVVIDGYILIKSKKQDDGLVKLQEFALKHHLAVLLTHDREDWIDSCSGSTGLTAAVNTLWTLERRPQSNELTLRIKRRGMIGELGVRLSLNNLNAPWKIERR